MFVLGDKKTFAAEVGDRKDDSQLRAVDLWAAGMRLTVVDNQVFVPQFKASIESEVGLIKAGGPRQPPLSEKTPEENHAFVLAAGADSQVDFFPFLNWGPTTDEVTAVLFKVEERFVLTFQLQGHPDHYADQVHVVELEPIRLLEVLRGLVRRLASGSLFARGLAEAGFGSVVKELPWREACDVRMALERRYSRAGGGSAYLWERFNGQRMAVQYNETNFAGLLDQLSPGAAENIMCMTEEDCDAAVYSIPAKILHQVIGESWYPSEDLYIFNHELEWCLALTHHETMLCFES